MRKYFGLILLVAVFFPLIFFSNLYGRMALYPESKYGATGSWRKPNLVSLANDNINPLSSFRIKMYIWRCCGGASLSPDTVGSYFLIYRIWTATEVEDTICYCHKFRGLDNPLHLEDSLASYCDSVVIVEDMELIGYGDTLDSLYLEIGPPGWKLHNWCGTNFALPYYFEEFGWSYFLFCHADGSGSSMRDETGYIIYFL
ncbi:MAG: hypothetical protein B6D65_05620 [candidate division Zixibacteria bacterium 4484_93]|nr:MAG: hypothetical protein B6D65_05620 [candidate division Zixibacteria bacterium 4484_93]